MSWAELEMKVIRWAETRCLAGSYEQIKNRQGTLMPFVKEQA